MKNATLFCRIKKYLNRAKLRVREIPDRLSSKVHVMY